MESKSLEEKKRYLNYLIILNSDIRKVYIVETRVIPGDKNDIIKLIKSEIEQISPDLDLILNQHNDNIICVVNKRKIRSEDITFLENLSASLNERIQKDEDAKLGNLLGYMCPFVFPETPLRMNILYTAKFSNEEPITLFNFICVLTQQNFQRSKELLANIKEALLSTGVIVNMLIQGPNKTINSTQLNASKLPNENQSPIQIPKASSSTQLQIPIDRQLNYLIILNSNIRKAYFLGLGYNTPNLIQNMPLINAYNQKIKQEISQISSDLELVLNKDNRFIFVVNKTKIQPDEIDFLQNIPTFSWKNMNPNDDNELGRLLGYQCKMVTGKRSEIKYVVKRENQDIYLFSFACHLTKSKFELCRHFLEDIKNALPDYEVILYISKGIQGKSINSDEINIDSLPDDEILGGKYKKSKKSSKKSKKTNKKSKKSSKKSKKVKK